MLNVKIPQEEIKAPDGLVVDTGFSQVHIQIVVTDFSCEIPSDSCVASGLFSKMILVGKMKNSTCNMNIRFGVKTC